MQGIDTALVVFAAIVSFPLAVWLGAALTRQGRLLHQIAARHFRLAVVGLVVLHVAGRVLESATRPGLGTGVEMTATYLLAMLFVPMLRRLQGRTEEALRSGGIMQREAENESGVGPREERG